MSLNDEIARYIQSDKYKEEVRRQLGQNPTFGSGRTKAIAEKYAEEIYNDLTETISLVASPNFVERMLDSYYTEVKFVNGQGWVVELFFDDMSAFSASLDPDRYEDGAYLPLIFNNGWNARGQVFGYWVSKDVEVMSRRRRKGSYFIQKAVDAFNNRHEKDGARALYNPVYDGASYDWFTYLDGDDWAY